MSNDDQRRRELAMKLAERAKKRAAKSGEENKRTVDDMSIAEVLEEISEHADAAIESVGRLGARNSEAMLQEAPTSEADFEPPTIEAQIGETPDAFMPEAAIVRPKRKRPRPKRPRQDAREFPAQPPPVPDTARRRRETPTKPQEPATLPSDVSPAVDLRPAEVGPSKEWDLEGQTSLQHVLLELASRPGTGLLELRSGRARAQLIIEDGQLFELRLLPSSPKRSLLSFLMRGGKISAETAADIEKFARRHNVTHAKALLGLPHILPAEVVRSAVCSRLRYLLRRLLDANLTRAEYFRLDDVSSSLMIVSIPVVGVAFAHVRGEHSGKYSGQRARTRARLEGMQLVRKTSLRFSFNQLGLKLYERQLVDRVLQKPRTFEKVLDLSPLPQEDTVALLGALESVGLLEVREVGYSSLHASSWAEEYSEAIARLEVMESRLERENYFSLFGLHWATYDAEVEKRYTELKAAFETLNQPLGLNGRERLQLRSVRKQIKNTYEVLSAPKQRQRYRNRLVSAATRRRVAGQLETLAAASVRRKMYHSALDYVQRLLEIAPDNQKAARLLPVLLARTSVGQW